MLTIHNIDKLKINTIVLGDKQNGPNEYWAVKDVLDVAPYYEIHLKCTQCSPASAILGTDMRILLSRERSRVGGLVGGYRLHCIHPDKYRGNTYLSPYDMKAPGKFVAKVLNLLNQ